MKKILFKKYFLKITEIIAKITGIIVIIYGFLSSGRSLWTEFIKPNLLTDIFYNSKIENIKPGYNSDFIENEIGLPPTLVNKLGNFIFKDEKKNYNSIINFTERIYIQKNKYYIQTISDETNNVVFYSLVSLNIKLHLNLPLEFLEWNEYNLKQKLGLFNFSELPEPEEAKIIAPNQHIFYTEFFYFGRPGGYKTYFSGLSPYGVTYPSSGNYDFDLFSNSSENYSKYKNNQGYKDFRATEMPNAFGVMSTKNNEIDKQLSKYLLENGLGPNTLVIYDIVQ